jgi:RNA polymerase sigma-70 factor (ECF subfamily)
LDERSQTPTLFVPPSEAGVGTTEARLDRAVLEQVRRRNPEALEVFFETYFDRVHGFVRRLIGDPTQAEDVTQEVFLKIYRAADRLDPERDPMPWLMTIAHNACRDLWRSGAYRLGRRARSLEGTPGLDQELPATRTPESEALASERERLVQAAILELPESLRAPLLLHDYQGMGHEQIAEVLGIHYAAARKRYSRALAALAARLKETLR